MARSLSQTSLEEVQMSGATEKEDTVHNNTKTQRISAERQEGKLQVKSAHTRHAQLL